MVIIIYSPPHQLNVLVVDGYGSKAGADPDVWRAGLAVAGLEYKADIVNFIVLHFGFDKLQPFI